MVFVLDKLIEIVMGKLVDAGIKRIVSILDVNREMEALQRNVMNISLVLVDAESKKIEDKSTALWLAELWEVLYDAEDLLDDFADARDRRFYITVCFKDKISTLLRNINSNLTKITSGTSTLQLLASQSIADKKVSRYNSSRITDTCTFQLDSDVLGIDDDDAKQLANRIKGDSNPTPSLFAITGMGGIGKTTLARKVFNHNLIKDHFENKVWVCVSSNCTGEYLLKKIVSSIDNNYSESRDSLDELSSKLIEVVKEKKVFIVLDDIWDSRVWEKFLRVPLYIGANYSRILITTRNEKVAREMKIGNTHCMTKMNLRDGWSMLSKIVFEEKDNGDMKELADVGKQIVDKCKGLPLAIKVVGGVLRMTDRTKAAWRGVLSSKPWSMQDLPEDILPSLLLSYEDLPLHLKQCFIYCSLFPQDFEFCRAILPYMWIAEGFIQKEEGARMEESAQEYYNELLMRNLLQVTPDSDGSSKCKMHDLLHSLATFVSQNQYIYVDPKTFIGSSGLIRHRHLWLNVENMNGVPKKIIGQEYVRTLMLSTNAETDLLSGLRRLRVLDINGKRLDSLPIYYVRNMRQLRFLNISSIEFNSLPASIENLKNLQTLIVSTLKSRSLPKEIVELSNLRHLLVSDTPLQNMPIGFNNLKNLRVLNCFVVNDPTSANLEELKDLSELTDLSIYNLERVASKEEAKEAAIEKKTSLKCLKLHCKAPQPTTNDENSMEIVNFIKTEKLSIEKIEEVFAGIEIPENLTELSIDGFFGEQLPADHMGWSLLRQVKSLELKNCKSLRRLPSLGDMPKLERLHMTNLWSVAELGSDFVGSQKFPKLQDLLLVGMNDLEMIFDVEIGDFPRLVNLFISICPKLESLGKGLQHATCLKKLTVINVSKLESIENLRSISELKIYWNPSLRSVKNLPSLKKMDIEKCSALKVVEDVRELSSLSISADEEITSLPEWFKNTFASEEWQSGYQNGSKIHLLRKKLQVYQNGGKVVRKFPGAFEIGHPTVTDGEQIVSREENGMLASEHGEVKRKRVKVDSIFPGASSSSGTSREHVNDSMDVDTTQ